ncbi:MAG: transaldolase, partial [Gammaproteobacteria bacterium]
MSRLKQIRSFGQSIWLDFLSRDLIESGGLRRLIDEDGISGVTTNPTIFEKAVSGGTAYNDAIASMAAEGKSALDMYRRLTLRDVTTAADILHPVYEFTAGGDGFVSLEVSPHLAYDIEKTVAEARELWAALDRPNVLIKVPATEPGLAAVRRLIGEGINVNVTLLFGLARYEAVARAYLAGLDDRLKAGHSLQDGPVSVASFFLSRIDTLVDSLLEDKAAAGGEDPRLGLLRGETAIACARLAYARYRELFSTESFR